MPMLLRSWDYSQCRPEGRLMHAPWDRILELGLNVSYVDGSASADRGTFHAEVVGCPG